MSTEYLTEPGTEDNLRLIVDAHPFDAEPQEPSAPYPVLVDGIPALASIGSHGAYSQRIVITLEQEHPELGREFSTKYYMIETPGIVTWGHNGQSFTIEKIVGTA
ncbi:MAG: hypothetical protein CMA80_06105 [Euryarchaeota archaeon]|nr:hypothetical protein [Euryarchaeota archaeon]MEE3085117.1 hypothetical protein [Candidatus Thermoplasmatota archaeon]|tara:strand:+ start:303 stop:617 length:315 start_codon:yes stop_codon:yes gene_type:complete